MGNEGLPRPGSGKRPTRSGVQMLSVPRFSRFGHGDLDALAARVLRRVPSVTQEPQYPHAEPIGLLLPLGRESLSLVTTGDVIVAARVAPVIVGGTVDSAGLGRFGHGFRLPVTSGRFRPDA